MAVILVVEDDAFILQDLGWVMDDLRHDALLTGDMTGRFVPGGCFLQKPYSPAQLDVSLEALLH